VISIFRAFFLKIIFIRIRCLIYTNSLSGRVSTVTNNLLKSRCRPILLLIFLFKRSSLRSWAGWLVRSTLSWCDIQSHRVCNDWLRRLWVIILNNWRATTTSRSIRYSIVKRMNSSRMVSVMISSSRRLLVLFKCIYIRSCVLTGLLLRRKSIF
jgi:hypothetical protein